MRCVAVGCVGKKYDDQDIHMFRFNKDTLSKWCHNLRLSKRKLTPNSKLCSRHFEKECFLKAKLRVGSMPTKKLGHSKPDIYLSEFKAKIKRKRVCALNGCSGTSPPSRLFAFPTDERRENWLKVCRLKDEFENLKIIFICEKHFPVDMLKGMKLVSGAFPSYFLGAEEAVPADEQFACERYEIVMDIDDPLDTRPANSKKVLKTEYFLEKYLEQNQSRMTEKEEFRKTIDELTSANKKLLAENTALKEKNKEMQMQLERMLKESIEVTGASQSAKTLSELACNNQKKKYSEEEKQFILKLYSKCPKAITFFRDEEGFRLPSNSTIRSWLPSKDQDQSFQVETIEIIPMENKPTKDFTTMPKPVQDLPCKVEKIRIIHMENKPTKDFTAIPKPVQDQPCKVEKIRIVPMENKPVRSFTPKAYPVKDTLSKSERILSFF